MKEIVKVFYILSFVGIMIPCGKLTIPSAHGRWQVGSGDNPVQLGQNLYNIPFPQLRQEVPLPLGTAASNTDICN